MNKIYVIIKSDGSEYIKTESHDTIFQQYFNIQENSFRTNDDKLNFIKKNNLIHIIISKLEFFINCYSITEQQYERICNYFSDCYYKEFQPEYLFFNDIKYDTFFDFKKAITCFYNTSILPTNNDVINKLHITIQSPAKKFQFYSNMELESLVVNSGTEIPKGFCKACYNLNNINLPNELKIIDEEAFEDCTSLSSIIFPQSLTTIRADAFCGCTSLKNVNFNKKLIDIGSHAFKECYKLESVKLPSTLKIIKYQAFCRCESLKNVYIPKTISKIESKVFGDCSQLRNIIFY